MPWWDDIIAHLEVTSGEPAGLLHREGRERNDDSPARLEKLIKRLSTWSGGPLTRAAIAQEIPVHASVISNMARRRNADLLAPALALALALDDDQHLVLSVLRGRAGEVREGDPQAGPVGVHNLRGWAAHECLAGWALITATTKTPVLVVELLTSVLKGTIDDPAVAENLAYEPQHGLAVEPGDMLLGQLERLAQVEQAAQHLASETLTARGPTALLKARQAERHVRLPLIADELPYGFVKHDALADDIYAAAGHWRPGLDRPFLEGLAGGGRPWAAFALRGNDDVLDQGAEVGRIGNPEDARQWGRDFVRAVARDELESGIVLPAAAGSLPIRRIRGVHIQSRSYDLLLHVGPTQPVTGWTIDADASDEQAVLLARALRRHLDDLGGDKGVKPLTDELDARYGLLRVQAPSTDMRVFLRALALAGTARRAADA